jgi:integrase
MTLRLVCLSRDQRQKGDHVWTDDECAAIEARWPRGTRERLAFDLLLYTGSRRGDAVRLGWRHVRNGVATIRTEKTDQRVTITVLPPLLEPINAGSIGELTKRNERRGGQGIPQGNSPPP